MIKNRAKRLLAVAMIMAMILAMQIPAFAAPLSSFSISIEKVADPLTNPGKMILNVDADEWNGTTSPEGTLTIGYFTTDPSNITYVNGAGTAVDATFTGYSMEHDIVPVTTDITWRATFTDTANEISTAQITIFKIVEDENSSGMHIRVASNYSTNNIEVIVDGIREHSTGEIVIMQSVNGATPTEFARETVNGTYGSVTRVIVPTEQTTYSFSYTPDSTAEAYGYAMRTGSMTFDPTLIGTLPLATVPEYDVSAIDITVPDVAAAAAGLATGAANITVDITDLTATQILMDTVRTAGSGMPSPIPTSGTLIAAHGLRYHSSDPAFDFSAIPNAFNNIQYTTLTYSGLKAGDRVALMLTSMDDFLATYYATVDASGNASFNVYGLDEMLDTGTGLSANIRSAYLYAGLSVTPTPLPTPVPVSPSTGVY